MKLHIDKEALKKQIASDPDDVEMEVDSLATITAPCPLCKSETFVRSKEDFWGNVYYRVECIHGANCDGRSGFRNDKQMAVDHWNHLLTGSPPPDYTK